MPPPPPKPTWDLIAKTRFSRDIALSLSPTGPPPGKCTRGFWSTVFGKRPRTAAAAECGPAGSLGEPQRTRSEFANLPLASNRNSRPSAARTLIPSSSQTSYSVMRLSRSTWTSKDSQKTSVRAARAASRGARGAFDLVQPGTNTPAPRPRLRRYHSVPYAVPLTGQCSLRPQDAAAYEIPVRRTRYWRH
jgi:hypothetical protein